MKTQISIVDSDYARRAAILRALAFLGRHAEPYEDLQEFSGDRQGHRIVLVHDEGSLVRDLIAWSRRTETEVGIIAYSEQVKFKAVIEAMKLGAADYVAWPTAAEDIDAIVENCAKTMEPRWKQCEARAKARSLLDRLTPRERQVLLCMASGLSSRTIGDQLGISLRTVEVHRGNMLNKLHAGNALEAVRIAYESGALSGELAV